MPAEDNLKSDESLKQKLSALSKDALLKITNNLNNTFRLGMVTGLTGIIGYAVNLSGGGWKFLFLFILLASASYISGFFMGFLFGIPKRNNERESAYNLNTNLVDISDWLTKIIIGLGLIEIKKIPSHLESIGIYVQIATGGESSVKIFSTCCVVYFSVFGLYFGYNYMRLFLSGQYKEADDNLQKLTEKSDELKLKMEKQNIIPGTPDTKVEIAPSTQKSLADYDQLLKSTKTEAEYNFDDWYYKGVSAYNNKEYEKMIVYMQKALEKDSRSSFAPDAYLYLGLAYNGLKLNDKAIEANNKIVSDYSDYANLYLAYYNNGIYYSQLGRLDKSLEEYEKAINVNQNYALAWNNKGDTLIKLRREGEAMPAFDRSIQLDPSIPYPWYNRAYLYSLNNDKDNTILNLSKAIELDSSYKINGRTDIVFKNFWDDEDFKKLVE